MATQRASLSAFWASITDLLDDELVSHASLYVGALRKLADSTAWLRDEIARKSAALLSTSLGTTAKITGSVDIRTIVYDDITGALNGKTLVIASNNSGAITVTFGTGAGLAPTGPADVIAQILAASAGNPGAAIDSAGHLTLSSLTTGGSGTITATSGTALAVLGYTAAQTATGAASGGDGLSAVAGALITGKEVSLSAGTLRSMLQYIADNMVAHRATTFHAGAPSFTLGAWVATAATHAFSYVQATGGHMWMPLDKLTHGATLTGVSVGVTPPGSHVGLPVTMPNFDLIKRDQYGVCTVIATVTDSSPDLATYEVAHPVASPVLSAAIDLATYDYWLYFQGETGTNGLTGLVVGPPKTTSAWP